HTRWPRDWSSDVCSSDLNLNRWLIGTPFFAHASLPNRKVEIAARPKCAMVRTLAAADDPRSGVEAPRPSGVLRIQLLPRVGDERSEERRVGKECRCWWWT